VNIEALMLMAKYDDKDRFTATAQYVNSDGDGIIYTIDQTGKITND